MKKPQTPHLKIFNFSKKPFEVTRPIKPSPYEKISIPENLTPFSFNLPMNMKIEINHPENILPPPPRNLSNPLNNSTPRKSSQPLPKTSQTLPKASPPLQKKIKFLPEKSQPL